MLIGEGDIAAGGGPVKLQYGPAIMKEDHQPISANQQIPITNSIPRVEINEAPMIEIKIIEAQKI